MTLLSPADAEVVEARDPQGHEHHQQDGLDKGLLHDEHTGREDGHDDQHNQDAVEEERPAGGTRGRLSIREAQAEVITGWPSDCSCWTEYNSPQKSPAFVLPDVHVQRSVPPKHPRHGEEDQASCIPGGGRCSEYTVWDNTITMCTFLIKPSPHGRTNGDNGRHDGEGEGEEEGAAQDANFISIAGRRGLVQEGLVPLSDGG